MQSLGMSFNRLREHAEMQLHIIDELGISEKKSYTNMSWTRQLLGWLRITVLNG